MIHPLKKTNYLIAFLGAFILLGESACSDDMPLKYNNQTIFSNIKTRALTPIVESTSNPDLFLNWENITSINLNGGGKIDVPWVAVPGNSMNIPDYFRFDIKKEDSWEMLYHTLTDEASLEPNYILFYNRKTGIMKGFYYSPAYENNQNFYWVLEASQPSYIIPTNTLVQNYEKNKFVTTTNVINHSSINEIGHLNAGWNAFSFELPYSYGDNSNLSVSIFGYNREIFDIKLIGKYSGVINIPKEIVDDNNILSAISKYTKSASSILSAYAGIEKFLGEKGLAKALSSISDKGSSVAKFFKSISSLFSKTKIINIQGTMHGTIELNGSSSISKSGLVKSINNIPFNKEEIGLWNLKEPTLYSSKYFILKFRNDNPNSSCKVFHKLSCDENDESGFFNSKKNELNLDSYIVVNPAIKNEIESYKVIEASVFNQRDNFPIPYVYSTDESKDSLYTTNYCYYPNKGVFIGDYLNSNIETNDNYLDESKLYDYFLQNENTPLDNFSSYLDNHVYMYNYQYMITDNSSPLITYIDFAVLNIVVQFTYKDGHTFISSRNYPIKIKTNKSFDYESIKKELLQQGLLLDENRTMFAWPMPLQHFLIQ